MIFKWNTMKANSGLDDSHIVIAVGMLIIFQALEIYNLIVTCLF